MDILTLNLFLYISWAIFAYKLKPKLDIYIVMVFFYTFLAFMGVYTVQSGIYANTFGTINVNKLVVIPYVCCFITYAILIQPLSKLTNVDISCSKWIFDKSLNPYIMIWYIVAISLTIIKLNEAAISIASGLGDAYVTRHIEGENLFSYDNFILNQINGKGPFFMDATIPIAIYYSIVGYRTNRIGKKTAISLFVLSFAWSFFANIAYGSRGGIFMTAFCILFFIFIFIDFFSREQTYKIFITILGLFGIFLMYSWIITIERIGEYDGMESIFRYFGESFPNLGFSFWDKVQCHPMGERLFPVDESRFDSIDDFYAYWGNVTGVPVLNFKTFFGDLYIEFGIWGAFMFTIILAWFFNKYVFSRGVNVITLPLVYFYFQLCVFSFAGFTKGGHHTTFQIIVIFLITFGLWISKNRFKEI